MRKAAIAAAAGVSDSGAACCAPRCRPKIKYRPPRSPLSSAGEHPPLRTGRRAAGAAGSGAAGRRAGAGPVRAAGEGAVAGFTPGARTRWPLLLALPALADTGLLACARQLSGGSATDSTTWKRLRAPGVAALLREPRAEVATRVPPPATAGCPAWTRPRKSRRSAARSASSPRRQGRGPADGDRPAPRATRPGELGFMYIDGHTRAFFGTRHCRRCTSPG